MNPRVKLLQREEFIKHAIAHPHELFVKEKDGEPPVLLGLTKDLISVIRKAEDAEDKLLLKFIISDEKVDRDRDTIRVAGWQLKNFKKNPVVLWSHMSWDPPIAKSVEIGPDGDKLVSTAEFMPQDMNPFSFMVFRMLDGGWLNAVSVGFIPEKYEFVVEEEAERRGGVNFMKQELLEYSVCPIPSNPRALMLAHEAGIDLKPLTGWCCNFLDLDPKTVKVVARQEIEGAWKKLADRPLYFDMKAEPETPLIPTTPLDPKEKEIAIRIEEGVRKLLADNGVVLPFLQKPVAEKSFEEKVNEAVDATLTKLGIKPLEAKAQNPPKEKGLETVIAEEVNKLLAKYGVEQKEPVQEFTMHLDDGIPRVILLKDSKERVIKFAAQLSDEEESLLKTVLCNLRPESVEHQKLWKTIAEKMLPTLRDPSLSLKILFTEMKVQEPEPTDPELDEAEAWLKELGIEEEPEQKKLTDDTVVDLDDMGDFFKDTAPPILAKHDPNDALDESDLDGLGGDMKDLVRDMIADGKKRIAEALGHRQAAGEGAPDDGEK